MSTKPTEMRVDALWRYPVKSMAGEPLSRACLGPLGVEGDRSVLVQDGRGRVVTSRTAPRLLLHRGTTAPDGQPLVDGCPWDSAAAQAAVDDAVPRGARLVATSGPERFDVLPLMVLTDGALSRLGTDTRRLRPNLVVSGVEGLEERHWPGRWLQIGTAVVALRRRRARCVMTTWDPDTAEQDLDVLVRIHDEFAGELGLDAYVARAGEVAVGDEARFVPAVPHAPLPRLGRNVPSGIGTPEQRRP
jgi:uncharacterized protein YcbX